MLSTTQISKLREIAEQTNSAQLYVVQEGQCLVDDVWHDELVDVFAVQKGLLALLIGVAEHKYLIETLDHINHHLAPEWTQLSPWDEAKLSIETLLSMTTGMDDELALEGEINTTWRYNNTAYQYLKDVLTQQSDLTLQQLSEQWLFAPLGMSQSHWVDRDQKTPAGKPFTGLLSSAKELSKLGELVLGNGCYEQQTLVPDYFIEAMVQPGSEQNPAWGWCWWNNCSSHHLLAMREPNPVSGPIIPAAPADLVAARGAYGNYLHVVPSLDLVIARTARAAKQKPAINFEQAIWEALAI